MPSPSSPFFDRSLFNRAPNSYWAITLEQAFGTDSLQGEQAVVLRATALRIRQTIRIVHELARAVRRRIPKGSTRQCGSVIEATLAAEVGAFLAEVPEASFWTENGRFHLSALHLLECAAREYALAGPYAVMRERVNGMLRAAEQDELFSEAESGEANNDQSSVVQGALQQQCISPEGCGELSAEEQHAVRLMQGFAGSCGGQWLELPELTDTADLSQELDPFAPDPDYGLALGPDFFRDPARGRLVHGHFGLMVTVRLPGGVYLAAICSEESAFFGMIACGNDLITAEQALYRSIADSILQEDTHPGCVSPPVAPD